MMNCPHNQKTKRIISLKLKGRRCSPATEFKKGNIPWNKGLKRRGLQYAYHNKSETKFKPGHRPKNWLPVSTIIIRIDTTGKAYHLIKVAEPKKWEYLSRHVWEATRGREIPSGFIIYHLDGISLNDSQENLICVSRSIHIAFCKIDIEDFESRKIRNVSIASKRRWREYRERLAQGVL